jgi:hypothetical protein
MIKLPLIGGDEALIDDEDYELVKDYQWYGRKDGYVYRVEPNKVDGRKTKTIYLHRVIMQPPPVFDVDHIDHNPLNNTRANLRIVPHHVNLRNRLLQSNNTSGYKGVTWDTRHDGWLAQAKYFGRHYNFGVFKNKTDAIWASTLFWEGVEAAESSLIEYLNRERVKESLEQIA